MALYIVKRAWFGVKVGDVVELGDVVHPALRANVEPAPKGSKETEQEQGPAVPELPRVPAATKR